MNTAAILAGVEQDRTLQPRWTTEVSHHHLGAVAGGRALSHIPGRAGLPIVGIMPEAMLDPLRFTEQMYRRFGPVHRFYACGSWNVQLIGPEANELVLFDQGNRFSAAGGWARLVGRLFPQALLQMDGAEHRTKRRLLGEAFKVARMEGYQRIFANDIVQVIRAWRGRTIDVYSAARELTLGIAASTFLGLERDKRTAPMVQALAAMIDGALALFASPLLSPASAKALQGKATLERIIGELIPERRCRPGSDVFSHICQLNDEEGDPLSDSEIIGLTIFLLAAAQDTLSSAITSVIHCLSLQPAWVDTLRAEACSAGIKNIADGFGASLPLHDMVFKEALRLYAPAPVIWRRARQSFKIYGVEVPANAMIAVNALMTHRLDHIWPNPTRFDPSRFTPEAEKSRHRFAFIPFGGGVHKCLGMHFAQQQARLLLIELLKHCDLVPGGAKTPRWTQWPNARPRTPLAVSMIERIHER